MYIQHSPSWHLGGKRGALLGGAATLKLKQAVSQLPEVVGRSGNAHWIGIRLKWFRCQETVRVRIFDGESWVPNMLAKKYSLQFRNKLYYITATIIHLRNNI